MWLTFRGRQRHCTSGLVPWLQRMSVHASKAIITITNVQLFKMQLKKSFRILIIVIFFGILCKKSLRNLERSHNTKQQRRCEESRVWNHEFIEIFEFEETWSRMVKDYNLWSNYRKAHSIEIIKLGLRNCWINSIFKLFKLFAVVWYYL